MTGISKYVPDDLRDRFDAWVRHRFDALGRAINLGTSDQDPSNQAQRDVLLALALARDPRLEMEAVQVKPIGRSFVDSVVTLVANSSPTDRDSLLAELDPAHGNASRREKVIEGLSRSRGIVEVFKNDRKKLDGLESWDVLRLFSEVCSTSDRKDLSDVIDGKLKDAPRILGRIDECIATKKRLDVEFRKWLANVASP